MMAVATRSRAPIQARNLARGREPANRLATKSVNWPIAEIDRGRGDSATRGLPRVCGRIGRNARGARFSRISCDCAGLHTVVRVKDNAITWPIEAFSRKKERTDVFGARAQRTRHNGCKWS